MLALSVFATAGGRGIPAGINDAPPVYFFPVGENQFQTLLLNLPFAAVLENDAPVWEGNRTSSGPIGFCEGITWMPRQILLGPLEPGACTLTGNAKHGIVRRMIYQAGRSRTQERDRAWLDPHVRIQTDKKKALPLRPPNPQGSPDRFESFWRTQVLSILDAFEPDAQTPPALCQLASLLRDNVIKMDTVRIEIVALHSDGKAKLFGATNKLWAFPTPTLLEKEKRDAMRVILSELDTHVERMVWRAAKHRYDSVTIGRKASLRAQFESAAERIFLRWLGDPMPLGEWIQSELDCAVNGAFSSSKKTGELSESSEAQCAFISQLFVLSAGDKTRLRAMLGRNPCWDVQAGDLFTGIFWPLRQKKLGRLERESCWIVATLFAFNELPGGERAGMDIGAVTGHVKSWGFRNDHEKKRAERRFKNLLQMDRAQLALPLAVLIRILRKRNVPVDWTRLLTDLTEWNAEGKPVQARWKHQAGSWS